MFDMKSTKMLDDVKRRRCNSLSSTASTCAISILCILVLVRQISSFPLISSNGGIRSRRRETLSVQRSTSTDAEIEDAVRLGQSEFEKYFEFPLDDWQLQAGGSIVMGHNVIVCSPTGSGKTVVGEMALHSAFDRDLDGVYTTPLKALSNQKFNELRQTFGNINVGLSTGDISINKGARLTVMTTEVYRNIAWRSSGEESETDKISSSNDLRKNSVVVLDEFHYMGQPGRGGVWEECVITSPAHTQIIGLSATLANAKELADWMTTVTGRHTELIEAPGARPVPLKYLFATREGLFPLFRNEDAGPGSPLGLMGYRGDGIPSTPLKSNKKQKDEYLNAAEANEFLLDQKLPKGLQINPALSGLAQRRVQKVNRMLDRQKASQKSTSASGESDWYSKTKKGRGRGRRSDDSRSQFSSRVTRKEVERLTKKEMRKAVPSLTILLTRLKEKNLLPAIFFIFSRAGCDQTAETISNAFKGPQDPNFDLDFLNDLKKPPKKKTTFKRKSTREKKKSTGKEDNDIMKDNQGRSFRLSSNNVDENAFNSVINANGVFAENDFSISGSPLSSENWKSYSSNGLLSYDEVKEVAERVAQFNEENPEIAFPDDNIEQLLFGLGRHHAGMLPAHKMLIENLFRMNLMKAVFATETLSAGINMPARTTVICSLAKRGGGGSMVLLETSNLIQMAGRAGRRGMDTTGTCVLVATPFEGEDVAATILTDPIKPISSQFRPSYSLAVNLIARGKGRLDVAKQLVSKSFANWGRQQIEEARNNGSSTLGEVADVLVQVSEEKFLNALVREFDLVIQKRTAKVDVAFLAHLTEILKDRELLKKSSKNFESVKLTFELESTTMGCLELELKEPFGDDVSLSDEDEILQQVEDQRERLREAEKKLRRHPFSSIAKFANDLLNDESMDTKELLQAYQKVQGMDDGSSLDAEDIVRCAKSAVVVKRKLRKLAKSTNSDLDPETLLLLETQKLMEEPEDSAWKDMLAITKALIAYGCIVPTSGLKNEYSSEDLEDETFEVTPAGTDIGMLSFENSLWCYLAMGGTFDVTNASAKFDEMKDAMSVFGDDDESDDMNDYNDDNSGTDIPSKAQQEAEDLLYHLQELSAGEMAGYISCLVTGDTGRSNKSDSLSVFKRLGPRLQRSIQVLLDATERFTDVQRQYLVDEKSCSVQFDLSHCEVVTAWAEGCTWNEALEISGAAPGDLTRIIGRATDAVRQFGALKFNPIRKSDLDPEEGGGVDPLSRGIHPELRRLCREAAKDMNRYPVKDPLPFDAEVDSDVEVDEIFSEDEDSEEDDDDDSDDDDVTSDSEEGDDAHDGDTPIVIEAELTEE